MLFYTGELVPAWRGSLFIGGLGSLHLVRLTLDGDKVVGEERLLTALQPQPERIRGEYLFVGPENPGGAVRVLHVSFEVEATGHLLQNFRTVVDTMESAIREGVFRPRTETFSSKTPCFFCDYQTICGPGHEKRYASKKDDLDPAVRMLALLEDVK